MSVTTYERDRRIHIQFPYSAQAVALAKALPGAKYHVNDKSWSVSARYLKRLPDLLGGIDALVTEQARSQREVEAVKEQAKIDAKEEADRIRKDRERENAEMTRAAISKAHDALRITPVVSTEHVEVLLNPPPFTYSERFFIRFPYCESAVDAVKSIPGASWVAFEKAWSVPVTSHRALADLLPTLDNLVAPISIEKARLEERALLFERTSFYADRGEYSHGGVYLDGGRLLLVLKADEVQSNFGKRRISVTVRMLTLREALSRGEVGLCVCEDTKQKVVSPGDSAPDKEFASLIDGRWKTYTLSEATIAKLSGVEGLREMATRPEKASEEA